MHAACDCCRRAQFSSGSRVACAYGTLCSGVNACLHLSFAQQWQPPGGLAAASRSVSVHSQRTLLFNLLPPGEACAIQPLEGAAPLAGLADFTMQDELHSQLFLPAPRYVLVRCSCMHEATSALWQFLTSLLH